MPAPADDDWTNERERRHANRRAHSFDAEYDDRARDPGGDLDHGRGPADDLDDLFDAGDESYYVEPPRGRGRSMVIAVVVLALLAGFAGAGMWLYNQMQHRPADSSGPPPFEIEPVSAKAYVDVPPPAATPATAPTPQQPRSSGSAAPGGKPAGPKPRTTTAQGTTGGTNSTSAASASNGGQPTTETVDDWATRISAYTDIPQRVLVAYENAQRTITATDPGCHMSWATLAGIGRAESRHGTHSGATVLSNGEESQPIIGPALDGTTAGLQVVHDTDHGKLDGDPKWDHALGPMQFLPETWKRYGMRADRDGRAPDPQNMDDAALTAAHYLCLRGGNLETGRGWWSAVLTYNNSVDYGLEVFSAAVAYAKASHEPATSTAPTGN